MLAACIFAVGWYIAEDKLNSSERMVESLSTRLADELFGDHGHDHDSAEQWDDYVPDNLEFDCLMDEWALYHHNKAREEFCNAVLNDAGLWKI